jgi:hypothetical protein
MTTEPPIYVLMCRTLDQPPPAVPTESNCPICDQGIWMSGTMLGAVLRREVVAICADCADRKVGTAPVGIHPAQAARLAQRGSAAEAAADRFVRETNDLRGTERRRPE